MLWFIGVVVGKTVGYFSPLQACLVPAGPQGEDIQVSPSPGVSVLGLKCVIFFSHRDLPSTYGGNRANSSGLYGSGVS